MTNQTPLLPKGRLRKISFNEKLYTLCEDLSPAFAIQVFIEGHGLLGEELLRNSLTELARKIPALQLKMQGKNWHFDQIQPQLIIHQKAFSQNLNAPVLRAKLNANHGKAYEFHAFQGESTTLVIRVLHSLMDGVGVLNMIDAWFDLMNNKAAQSYQNYPRDEDFRDSLEIKPTDKRKGYPFKWKGLQHPVNKEPSLDYVSDVVELNHRVDGLIGKLGEWYMQQTNAPAQFLIPVNVRRHQPDLKSVANLSLPIYLETNTEENAQEIQAKLLSEMYKNNELAKDQLEGFGKMVPSSILKPILKSKVKSAQRKNLYPMSGFLSDLGNVNIDRLKTETFTTTNLYSLPVYVPLAPFCVLSCQHKNGTRIGISIPKSYDLIALRESLIAFLQPEEPEKEIGNSGNDSALSQRLREIWAEILLVPAEKIQSNDSYAAHGGSSLNLLILINKVEKEILQKKSKKLLAQTIKFGGKVTINDMEAILIKLQSK